MKLNKVFAALMAVVTLVAFTACGGKEDVIKLKLNKMNLEVGQTYTIQVEQASGDITWATSNDKVATVDTKGMVTAVAEGQAAITATVGKAVATVDVTVAASAPSAGAPDLDAPANGKLKVVIEIPAGSECNGIALKGNIDGDDTHWSGANTYLGEDGAQTPVDGKIYKFAAIEGFPNWYQLEMPCYDALQFKICLIYKDDSSWEGEASGVALHDCNFSNIEPTIEGGQFKDFSANGGLLYVKVDGWKKSECVQEVLEARHVTLIVPDNTCGAEVPSIVGSFNGWNATEIPMTLVAGSTNKYEATIQAYGSDQFKFAGSVSGWDNEPQQYDAEKDEYRGLDNVNIGNEKEFAIDLHDGKWKACAE